MPSCDRFGTEILQARQKIVPCLLDKHYATSHVGSDGPSRDGMRGLLLEPRPRICQLKPKAKDQLTP